MQRRVGVVWSVLTVTRWRSTAATICASKPSTGKLEREGASTDGVVESAGGGRAAEKSFQPASYSFQHTRQ